MSYAMILASLTSDYTSEEILSQCLTLGPYLLGLGLGSLACDKIRPHYQLKGLLTIEGLSVLFLPLLPVILMAGVFAFINFSPFNVSLDHPSFIVFLLSVSSLLSFSSGLLGGGQLPLIIKIGRDLKDSKILAINYMGPLLAGPFIVIFTGLGYRYATLVAMVGILQILGLLFLINHFRARMSFILALSLPLLILVGVVRYQPELEYLTAKSGYIGTKVDGLSWTKLKTAVHNILTFGELERIRTPYQSLDFYYEPAIPEFNRPHNGTLFLNRKPQFDFFSIAVYHETMVHAGINLLGFVPKNVLILGAGDGILLSEITRVKEIEKVTMVELDPGVIEWARKHPFISDFNRDSLSNPDPRVNLIIDDGISFLRNLKGKKKFDLILIDFPFPNGHELSKLYSYEFYTLVRRSLSAKGIVSLDLPVQLKEGKINDKETLIIMKTLKAAGLGNMIVYGPYASFLSVKADSDVPLAFDYENFPDDLSLSTRVNLVEIFKEDSLSESEWKRIQVNSMFRPGDL